MKDYYKAQIGSPGVCMGDFHVYPTIYSGDPQYAARYFSRCLCGKKKKVTTVKEVDVAPLLESGEAE